MLRCQLVDADTSDQHHSGFPNRDRDRDSRSCARAQGERSRAIGLHSQSGDRVKTDRTRRSTGFRKTRRYRRCSRYHPRHYLVETVSAMLSFSKDTAIFVCHDRLIWHDFPPVFEQARRFVAVDRNCLERLRFEAGVAQDKISLDIQRGRYDQISTKNNAAPASKASFDL